MDQALADDAELGILQQRVGGFPGERAAEPQHKPGMLEARHQAEREIPRVEAGDLGEAQILLLCRGNGIGAEIGDAATLRVAVADGDGDHGLDRLAERLRNRQDARDLRDIGLQADVAQRLAGDSVRELAALHAGDHRLGPAARGVPQALAQPLETRRILGRHQTREIRGEDLELLCRHPFERPPPRSDGGARDQAGEAGTIHTIHQKILEARASEPAQARDPLRPHAAELRAQDGEHGLGRERLLPERPLRLQLARQCQRLDSRQSVQQAFQLLGSLVHAPRYLRLIR
ncbi:MAG TPA: hypothetical protein VNW24_06370 [Stellaceae bacterium]|nr:hypothetical protein [Stellaceae bacterium]